MICHIVAIPQINDLHILNNLRSYVYQNGFRFKNKPLDSDTHMTVAEVEITGDEIAELKEQLTKNIRAMPFKINEEEWMLTKENKEPNYKIENPYAWIALKFPLIKDLYDQVDEITQKMGVNNNKEYNANVSRIENRSDIFLANHVNLSNYTRIEMADECWEYFKNNIPKEITFDKLALRNLNGDLLFEIKY